MTIMDLRELTTMSELHPFAVGMAYPGFVKAEHPAPTDPTEGDAVPGEHIPEDDEIGEGQKRPATVDDDEDGA